jgi:hypothetical protein
MARREIDTLDTEMELPEFGEDEEL